MKTKTGISLLALALAFSLAACKGNHSGSSADSSRVDSSSVTRVDSIMQKDTAKTDSMKMTDTSKKKADTVTKVKTTEEKKSAKKKE
jgi:hypothetical protein